MEIYRIKSWKKKKILNFHLSENITAILSHLIYIWERDVKVNSQ